MKYVDHKLQERARQHTVTNDGGGHWTVERKKDVERKTLARLLPIKLLKLTNLRQRINLVPERAASIAPMYQTLLKKSKDLVAGWNGKLYLVYVPRYSDPSNLTHDQNHQASVGTVLAMADRLEIPVINMEDEVIRHHPDPPSLYPFRTNEHHNGEANRLLAAAILKRLRNDGVITGASHVQ